MLYEITIPQFIKMLQNLHRILEKASLYASAKKIEMEVLLNSRLFPDQFNLIKQIQIACDTAKLAASRLTGKEAPLHEDKEKTALELKTRIEEVIHYLKTFSENQNAAQYSVRCPSCEEVLTEKVEYCPNCGSELDVEKLFSTPEKNPLTIFVEEVLQKLNINPVVVVKGPDYWEFHQGSALVRIFVFKKDYLYTTSPIAKLPKKDLENIYKYLLSNPVAPYTLGVYGTDIFISYRIHLSDINSVYKAEIQKNISALALKADELDNFLMEKFGCEKTEFTKM